MSQHDDETRLRHMLDHAREAVSFVAGRVRADLDLDRVLNLALVRLIEVVGEAATRVTRGRRDAQPGIPWQEIIGMRNRIVHGYDSVDFDILWAVITQDLPPLIAQLEAILGEPPTSPAR